jgi:hypothetical protein
MTSIGTTTLRRTLESIRRRGALPNNELQRTSDGNAAGSPLNSVLGGPKHYRMFTALPGSPGLHV